MAYSKPSRMYKMELFIKIVMSWKPKTSFGKSSILDVRLGSEYTSAVRVIQNKTKFEHTKERFILEGLLNIVYFQFEYHWAFTNSISTKTTFPLLFVVLKGFLMYIQQNFCNNILHKNAR